MTFTFEKATFASKDTIFSWLNEPHVQEFWDNSPEHRDDIINFVEGRKTPSSYWNGLFSYWIALSKGTPFCLIMTHPEDESTNPPDYFKPYLSTTGKTFGLDYCIGNPDFLGKGFAAPTLKEFTTYFSTIIEPLTDTFIIDPETTNPRAIHVYQKAGFQIMQECTFSNGFFEGNPGVVMIKKIDKLQD